MARLTPLPAPVPETLEALLGYEGDAEWLALYVERNFGEVVGDEGNLPFVLAEDAYRLYTEHRAVAPHLAGYDLEGGERPARSRLLLNRQTRTLYVVSARAVRARVRAQWPEPPWPPQGSGGRRGPGPVDLALARRRDPSGSGRPRAGHGDPPP